LSPVALRRFDGAHGGNAEHPIRAQAMASVSAPPPPPPPSPLAPPKAARPNVAPPAPAPTVPVTQARASAPTPRVATPATAPTVKMPTPVVPARAGERCRLCDGVLPAGREITFCPHCGQNVTRQDCLACGAELELGWKFCPVCGRPVGGAGSGAA